MLGLPAADSSPSSSPRDSRSAAACAGGPGRTRRLRACATSPSAADDQPVPQRRTFTRKARTVPVPGFMAWVTVVPDRAQPSGLRGDRFRHGQDGDAATLSRRDARNLGSARKS